MFTEFFIDNYRCFTNFRFQPKAINLLLGDNGSGKTTFLNLVRDVIGIIVHGNDVWVPFHKSSRTRWQNHPNQRFEFKLLRPEGLYNYRLTVVDEHILHENVSLDGKTLFNFSQGEVSLHNNQGESKAIFPFRGNRSFLAEIDPRPENTNLIAFRETLAKVVSLRLDSRRSQAHFSEQEQRWLNSDGSNFSSWYRHLSQESPEILQPMWNCLREVICGFQSTKLVSVTGNERELVVVHKTGGGNYEVAFHELSDGQRCLLILYTVLHSLAPDAIVLFDEPELHVSLSEIQPWLVELHDRMADSGQVLVASNHSSVIDYLAASASYYFERLDGGAVRVDTAPFDLESGDPASLQVARGMLATSSQTQ